MEMKKAACAAVIFAAASMSAVLADELAPAAAAPSLDVVAGGPVAGGPAAGPAAEAAAKSAAVAGSVPFMAVSLMSTLVAYLLP